MKLALAAAVLALAACSKSEPKATPAKAKPAPVTAGEVDATGTRKVSIEVKKDGYHPDSLAAKPNEKLKLVFTRVEDTSCGEQVKVGTDGKVYDLPMNQPVEIAVTVPASGKLDFACGMDMMSGVILVEG